MEYTTEGPRYQPCEGLTMDSDGRYTPSMYGGNICYWKADHCDFCMRATTLFWFAMMEQTLDEESSGERI